MRCWLASPTRAGRRGVDGGGGAVVGAARRPARRRAAGRPAAALARCAVARCRSLLPLLCRRVAAGRGSFDVVAADVGQGTAVLVRTRRHALLLRHAARSTRATATPASASLVPLLRSRGEHRIDLLVLSHRDSDHVGGARTLLGAIRRRSLASSLEDGHPLLEGAPDAHRCVAGQALALGRRRLRRPASAAPSDYARALRPNAMSCVLRVSRRRAAGPADRRHRARPGGGAGRRHTARRCAATCWSLRTTAARPRRARRSSTPCGRASAVFQAGYRNRFGHPAPEVLGRYRERGIDRRRQPGVRRLAVARRTVPQAAPASATSRGATGTTGMTAAAALTRALARRWRGLC